MSEEVRFPGSTLIDWDKVRNLYLKEWVSSTKKGKNKVHAGEFCTKYGIDAPTLSKKKNEEDWLGELSRKVVEKTEFIDPHFKQQISLDSMDHVRVMAVLDGSTVDPKERELWMKLGVEDYAEKLARYFTGISRGLPKVRAVNLAGITAKELDKIEKSVPIVESLYYEAVAQFELSMLEKIEAASKKDWKSAAYLLEKHVELRDYYKPPEAAASIQISISIDRSVDVQASGIIDTTADDAEIIDT